MINNYDKIFSTARVIFVIQKCSICRIWKQFIERENLKLKFDKKITVIDSTLLAEHGIYDDPLLRVFDKFIQDPPGSGSYFFPALFIEGNLITGANSKEEALSFIRAFLYDDYMFPYEKNMFRKECEYKKIGLFKKKVLVCNDGEEYEE